MGNCLTNLLSRCKKLFFVGIGGISMSSLALLALDAGYRVYGSDRSCSALVERCQRAGCQVVIGHREESVIGMDAVIYTAAVSLDSPELKSARERGIPTVSRGDFLGSMMLGYKTRIGVSGTHGKTTTTSMAAKILIEAGCEPTVAGGAVSDVLNGSALLIGKKDCFVYEACEYKASFHSFHPTVAVVTNVELDHTDYYASLEEITESFAVSLQEATYAVINLDDPNAVKAAEKFTGERRFFSLMNEKADYYAENIRYEGNSSRYILKHRGKRIGEVLLPTIGAFNIANSLAALAACHIAGVALERAIPALAAFEGSARRFEILYRENGITLADDYAHHPSEIAATLKGARAMGAERIIAVFQPHTYSRTKDLFSGFVEALSLADEVILSDIYAAREVNTYGISSEMLAKAIGEKATYMPQFEKIAAHLAKNTQKGDLVLTMGAGDVYKIGILFKEALAK